MSNPASNHIYSGCTYNGTWCQQVWTFRRHLFFRSVCADGKGWKLVPLTRWPGSQSWGSCAELAGLYKIQGAKDWSWNLSSRCYIDPLQAIQRQTYLKPVMTSSKHSRAPCSVVRSLRPYTQIRISQCLKYLNLRCLCLCSGSDNQDLLSMLATASTLSENWLVSCDLQWNSVPGGIPLWAQCSQSCQPLALGSLQQPLQGTSQRVLALSPDCCRSRWEFRLQCKLTYIVDWQGSSWWRQRQTCLPDSNLTCKTGRNSVDANANARPQSRLYTKVPGDLRQRLAQHKICLVLWCMRILVFRIPGLGVHLDRKYARPALWEMESNICLAHYLWIP